VGPLMQRCLPAWLTRVAPSHPSRRCPFVLTVDAVRPCYRALGLELRRRREGEALRLVSCCAMTPDTVDGNPEYVRAMPCASAGPRYRLGHRCHPAGLETWRPRGLGCFAEVRVPRAHWSPWDRAEALLVDRPAVRDAAAERAVLDP